MDATTETPQQSAARRPPPRPQNPPKGMPPTDALLRQTREDMNRLAGRVDGLDSKADRGEINQWGKRLDDRIDSEKN